MLSCIVIVVLSCSLLVFVVCSVRCVLNSSGLYWMRCEHGGYFRCGRLYCGALIGFIG